MSTTSYQQLAKRFGEVRRSWKRAAALSGLAIVVTESIGILTALLLLDWLYQPQPALRIAMWALALAGIIYFLVKHVAGPLARKIPDEQIALYIEEHRSELDGILITAAEYGQKRGDHEGDQAALIDAVVNEATDRARVSASRVVDFSRLRKYGVGAAAGICVYILLSILFPSAVGHHLARIFKPWRPTVEDIRHTSGSVLTDPVRFAFSKGDTSLVRGATFDFEVTLSRAAEQPVTLNFRPLTQGAQWQSLPVKEIEKLNAFQGTLADVSEDLEFQVVSGKDKSDIHKLMVFDPLVVQGMEVTTHYPAYAKLPDRVENPSGGDVSALEGSTVTVRLITSNALKDGKVKWNDGKSQELTVDATATSAAAFTFEVKNEGSYDYVVNDVNGQQAANAVPLTVHLLPDAPPTLKVVLPKAMAMTNPLGEVHFEVEADDDFGVEGVDLVYSRADDSGESHETRVPLTLNAAGAKDAPNAVHGSHALPMENLQPPIKPEEAISYYLEARDAKGQRAISPIGLVAINYFETWAVWNIEPLEPAHHMGAETGPDLMSMLQAVWQLDTQKGNMPPQDFLAENKKLGVMMCDNDGILREFVDLVHFPQLAKVADKIQLHAKNAREALAKGDTTRALIQLQTAVTISEGGKLMEDATLSKKEHSPSDMSSPAQGQETKMTLLEQARMEALKDAASKDTKTEKEKSEAQGAQQTAKGVEELMQKQKDLIEKSKTQSAEKSAAPQKELSQKTKELASKANQSAGAKPESSQKAAAEKLEQAAKAMAEAAKDFEAGRKPEGQAKAQLAQKALADAHAAATRSSGDKLEQAIRQVVEHAEALLEDQKDLRTKTETTAKAMGSNPAPDPAQAKDLQAQAGTQAGLQGRSVALNAEIVAFNDEVAKGAKPEIQTALKEAVNIIRRSQPEKAMAGAVVDLNQNAPGTAVGEQVKAEGTLAKIIESLRHADDAASASHAAQVKRAAEAAKQAQKSAQAAAQPKSAEAAQPKPGEAAQPKPAEGAQAKPGEAAQPKPAAAAQPKPGEAPQPKPGAQPKEGGRSPSPKMAAAPSSLPKT